MSDPIPVVLEAGTSDAEITVRVRGAHARDELLDDLAAEQLRGSRVMEFAAGPALEVLSTSLQTYGPIAGAVAGGFVTVRSIPAKAWEAFGNALTAWITRRNDARVEFQFSDGRRIVVENDPRAVRQVLNDVVLPAVREQQADRHEQWERMTRRPARNTSSDEPGGGSGGDRDPGPDAGTS